MNINNVLDRIITSGTGSTFYRITNAEGKVWLMPAHNMRTAMELYQPSGRNGKLLKEWLPWVYWLPMLRRFAHAEKMICHLSDEVQILLEQTFGIKDLEFSIFCGTPCVHQKITMQVSQGKQILGYCKFTDNKEIASLFEKETRTLRLLESKQMQGLPHALYCGKLKNDVYGFIQSTEKTRHSEVLHEWSALHEEFLNSLYEATKTTLPYEQSDYCKTLELLQEHMEWLPNEVGGNVVNHAYDLLTNKWQGKNVEFSAYHADFTPWNMFAENGHLFVFDWEYAQMTYPPMLDRYHFFTQTAIFEKHWTADDITTYMQSADGAWMDRMLYLAYLMDMIARFTIRERGHVTGDIARSMKLWNELLQILTQ